MGDGQYMSPVVGLDVEGHEYTHMVINHNGNGGLTYQGESGALNESFADIFGACVEFYSGVSPNWYIGEDVMIGQPAMRSMSSPNLLQQPDTYQGTYWVNTDSTQDNGGVHTNSGVQTCSGRLRYERPWKFLFRYRYWFSRCQRYSLSQPNKLFDP